MRALDDQDTSLTYSMIGVPQPDNKIAVDIDQDGNIWASNFGWNGGLNFEVNQSFTLNVKVTDRLGAQSVLSANVSINDVQEAPDLYLNALDNVQVGSLKNGDVIGSWFAHDQDVGDVANVFINSDSSNGGISISNDGTIRVVDDIKLMEQGIYSFEVTAEDLHGNRTSLYREFQVYDFG